MRNFLIFFVLGIAITPGYSQIPPKPWLKGYNDYVTGTIIGYNNALRNHGSALLARSLIVKKFIAWNTESLPGKGTAQKYTFASLATYDNVK